MLEVSYFDWERDLAAASVVVLWTTAVVCLFYSLLPAPAFNGQCCLWCIN